MTDPSLLSACEKHDLPRIEGTGGKCDLDWATLDRPDDLNALDEEMIAELQDDFSRLPTASPMGLRLTKACLNVSVNASSLEAALTMEDRNQILCTVSSDFRDGINTLLEKHEPAYRNQ